MNQFDLFSGGAPVSVNADVALVLLPRPPRAPRDPSRDQGPTKKTNPAAKFETLANAMQPTIDGKLADRQTNTPRRLAQAASARAEGERLQRTQAALRALAELHRVGTELPPLLAKLTSKKAVYDLMGSHFELGGNGYYDTGEMREDASEAASALWGLLTGKTEEEKQADQLREKIAALQFSKIPGYFPTPPAVVEQMIAAADIWAGYSILEPSGGSGAILDQLAALPEKPELATYEVNHTLREILTAKGYKVLGSDFLTTNVSTWTDSTRYDRILMNPPFENLADINHVLKAYGMLADFGRLVAIMSPGPFFRESKKAQGFRNWLETVDHTITDLPAGSFKESGTGVSAKLIVIDKPDPLQE